jgi:hypothetical protein
MPLPPRSLVLYAALVLIKIVASPYAQQPQVIFDQVTLAS